MGGLEGTGVNKVEGGSVKEKGVENPTGELRSDARQSGQLEVSNLVITLPEAQAPAFLAWRQSSVNGLNQKKNGQLDYLTPDQREALFTISFRRLGVFKITPESVNSRSENIGSVKVEMNYENMQFGYGPVALA